MRAGAGSLVRMDTAELRRLIEHDGRAVSEISRDAGLGDAHLGIILKRGGRVQLATFDAICGALGINGYEIEVTS